MHNAVIGGEFVDSESLNYAESTHTSYYNASSSWGGNTFIYPFNMNDFSKDAYPNVAIDEEYSGNAGITSDDQYMVVAGGGIFSLADPMNPSFAMYFEDFDVSKSHFHVMNDFICFTKDDDDNKRHLYIYAYGDAALPPPAALEANFEIENTDVLVGETVNFQDQSPGNPETWAWEFPGGTPSESTEQNPSVQYDEAGVFSVSLTVTRGEESESITREEYITVSEGVIADFSLDNGLIMEGESVSFQDLSRGQVESWAWEFPGGTPSESTEQNPSINYPNEGTFEVRLTVRDENGNSDTKSLNEAVKVSVQQFFDGDWDQVITASGSGSSSIQDVSVDSEGNLAITGKFSGTMELGGRSLNSTGGEDLFLGLLNPEMEALWLIRGGGNLDDAGLAIAHDAEDNIYLTGYFTGNASFAGQNMINSTNSGKDMYVAKFNAAGERQWIRYGGGNGQDEGRDLAVDQYGNVILTGFFEASAFFGSGQGLTAQSGKDAFLLKYNGSGTMLWEKQAGDNNDDMGYRVHLDPEHAAIYMTGEFYGNINFDGNSYSASGESNFFLAKYNLEGQFEWAKTSSGPGTARGSSLITDSRGNVYAGGTYQGEKDFEGSFSVSQNSSKDLFTVSYSATGEQRFYQSFGSSSDDDMFDLNINEDQQLVFSGTMSGSSQLGSGVSFEPESSSAGFILVLSDEGFPINILTVGSGSQAFPVSIYYVDGNFYLSGSLEGEATFGEKSVSSEGGLNSFLASFIKSQPLPQPSFITASTKVFSGEEVLFEDRSGNQPSSWEWVFEGAEPAQSSEQNPVVVYQEPGTYSVSLTVTNEFGTRSLEKEDYMEVEQGIEVDFIFENSPVKGEAVSFLDQSTGAAISAWDWEFPGAIPNQSNQEKPEVVYLDEGIFDVTLTVTGENGQVKSLSKADYVVISTGTSLNTEAWKKGIRVFPNPSKGHVQVQLPENHSYHSYQVHNLSGRKIKEGSMDDSSRGLWSLDLSEMASGLYILQLHDQEHQNISIRLIKE